MLNYILILASVALGSCGQLFFKIGVTNFNKAHPMVWSANFQTLGMVFRLIFHPLVFTGLFCYGLGTIIWLMILSRVNLSFAYPMLSLGYVVVALLSFLFLGEHISVMRWAGLFVIVLGVMLLAQQ